MKRPSQFEAFYQLSPESKVRLLLRLAHDLTIVGRDTYTVGGTGLDSPARLRAVNEIAHRILASCLALMEDSPKRYPDDALLRIILEHPDDIELQRQVLCSLDLIMCQLAPAA